MIWERIKKTVETLLKASFITWGVITLLSYKEGIFKNPVSFTAYLAFTAALIGIAKKFAQATK